MAWNPFHGFRKHAKVYFAILTIVCMFTFVLAFGQGDFFQTLLASIGASSRQGEVVTTLYGDEVYESDLQQAELYRHVANQFMQSALATGSMNAISDAAKVLEGTDPPSAADATSVKARLHRELSYEFYSAFEELLAMPGGIQRFNVISQKNPGSRGQMQIIGAMQNAFGPIGFAEHRLNSLYNLLVSLREEGMKDEVRLVESLIQRRKVQLWQLTNPQPTNRQERYVFGGSVGTQDLLDFLMWQHQADQLGIELTKEDIRAAVNRMVPAGGALVGDTAKDTKTLLGYVREGLREGLDLGQLYKALGKELRASLAQGVLLGREPGLRGLGRGAFHPPVAITPSQYLDYFRRQRTTMDVALLPLPVEAFLDQVKDSPTQKELQSLFDSYKNAVARPNSPTPGFKDPQRLRLEWITTRTLDPKTLEEAARLFPAAGYLQEIEDPRQQHYEQLAERLMLSRVAQLDPIAAAGAALRLMGVYERIKGKYPLPSLLAADPALSFATFENLPAVTAATAAQLANPLTPGGAFRAAITSKATALALARKKPSAALKQVARKRAQVVAGLVGLSIGQPLPTLGTALTRPVPWALANGKRDPLSEFPSSDLKTYLPMEAVAGEVKREAVKGLAAVMQREDTAHFIADMEKAKGDSEKARKIIDEAIKQYKLGRYHGKSEYLDTQYTIAKDPGLKPLRDAGLDLTALFRSGNTELPKMNQRLGVYDPVRHGAAVLWKTENIPTHTPTSLSEEGVHERVVRAWKMRRARELAEAKAKEIRAAIAGKSPKEALDYLASLLAEHPEWGGLIQLNKVALLKSYPSLDPGSARRYEPYEVPEEAIEYPVANFVSELLGVKEHGVAVLPDQPERHYYVAYIRERSVPVSAEEAFKERAQPASREMTIWDRLHRERVEKARVAMLEELRRQAGKVDARGRFALNPGIKVDEGREE